MALIEYEDKDIIPFVICTLSETSVQFVMRLYNVVVDKHFPDLKGLVANDYFDKATFELIDAIDDEIIAVTTGCMQLIRDCGESIENIYAVSLDDPEVDKRMHDMAEDFFWSVAIYNESENYREAIVHMQTFAYSISHMMYGLCLIILNGELDPEKIFSSNDGVGGFYEELLLLRNSDQPVIRLLVILGIEMGFHHRCFEELIAREND